MAWIVSHLIYSKGITSTSDRNKENDERICAFLYAPYLRKHRLPARINSREAENCIIE